MSTAGSDTAGFGTAGSDAPGFGTAGSDAPGSDTPGSDTPGSDTPGSAAAAEAGPGRDEPPAAGSPRVLVLEHDPSDPPLLLGEWLAEAGADVAVRRLHAGDEVPGDLAGWDALVSMGGEMGAHDDEAAPWLPAVRALLSTAVHTGTPTLGVCLGAQLLAVATGGRVERGPDGPEIGAYLAAKRDAAEFDPLFERLPLSPDVMHFHHDVISVLPPGAVLLMSSIGYPNQAFRIGSAAWGIQFHIETTAEVLRGWGTPGGAGAAGSGPDEPEPATDPREPVAPTARLGPRLDEAEEFMAHVWRAFAHRFVDLARAGVPATPTGHAGPRLPLIGGDHRHPAGPA